MKNRLYWLLLLIFIFWFWYIFYNFVYIPEQNRIQEEIEKQKIIEQERLEKEVNLVEKKEEIVELTPKEKIEKIISERENYKTFNFDSFKVYFIQDWNNLEMHLDSEKIWNFSLVYEKFLRVDKVLWSVKDLYLEVWKEKYYYNFNTKKFFSLNISNLDILYTKLWINSDLIIVTDKWSFTYSKKLDKLDFFTFFNDFVFFNDWYIWLIKKDDTRILKNLNLETTKDILLYYNPISKEKKIVYESEIDIIKIYNDLSNIFIEGSDNMIYELKNLK